MKLCDIQKKSQKYFLVWVLNPRQYSHGLMIISRKIKICFGPHTCTLLVEMMDSSESEYRGLVANMLKAIFSGIDSTQKQSVNFGVWQNWMFITANFCNPAAAVVFAPLLTWIQVFFDKCTQIWMCRPGWKRCSLFTAYVRELPKLQRQLQI